VHDENFSAQKEEEHTQNTIECTNYNRMHHKKKTLKYKERVLDRLVKTLRETFLP